MRQNKVLLHKICFQNVKSKQMLSLKKCWSEKMAKKGGLTNFGLVKLLGPKKLSSNKNWVQTIFGSKNMLSKKN